MKVSIDTVELTHVTDSRTTFWQKMLIWLFLWGREWLEEYYRNCTDSLWNRFGVPASQSLHWVTSGLRYTVNSTNYFGSHQNICYKFNPIFTNLQHPKQRLCGMPFCGLTKELRYTNTHGHDMTCKYIAAAKRNRKGGQNMSADTVFT